MGAKVERHEENRAIVVLVSIAMLFACAMYLYRSIAPASTKRASGRLSNDPPYGVALDLPTNDYRRRQITRSNTLVLIMGECSSCSIKKIDFSAIRGVRWPQIIAVFNSSIAEIKSSVETNQGVEAFMIISDVDGKLARQLNAFWVPRWYVIDDKFRIKIAQQNREDSIPNVQEVYAK
jgi:hypothetical protein